MTHTDLKPCPSCGRPDDDTDWHEIALDLAKAMKAQRLLEDDTDPFEALKVHVWCEAALARFYAAEGER